MIIFISSTVIYSPFRDTSCRFVDIVIITTFLEIHVKNIVMNVKVQKHQKNVINNLMKRNNIVIMNQDKGRAE